MSTHGLTTHHREDLLARLADSRRSTDELFTIVRPEAIYDRPIPERHRILFYIGHLEAFDWNLLGRGAFGLPAFNESFDKLFAFGIDPVGGGLPDDLPTAWPTVEATRAYGDQVRRALDERLVTERDMDEARLADYVNVAIEHRLMHAETLAYMLHQLGHDRKLPQPQAAAPAGRPVPGRLIEIPAGTATLGRKRGSGFGWDNEFEEHAVRVPAFAVDELPVTNGQFLKFMKAGGYDNRGLWAADDWEWRSKHDVRHPAFWAQRGQEWMYVGMFDEVALPPDWPVYVSLAEARAYTNWAGRSLLTEAQFHRAAFGTPEGSERVYPWGEVVPGARHGNFDFDRWDPSPVGAYGAGDSAFGVAELVCNGWEWTQSRFEPFKGFEAFPFYPGYSANFFDGLHYVMKGGSARTASCMLRGSFRNWFQAHYPYVYAKFRGVWNG